MSASSQSLMGQTSVVLEAPRAKSRDSDPKHGQKRYGSRSGRSTTLAVATLTGIILLRAAAAAEAQSGIGAFVRALEDRRGSGDETVGSADGRPPGPGQPASQHPAAVGANGRQRELRPGPETAGIDPVRRSPKSAMKTVVIGFLGCRCTSI